MKKILTGAFVALISAIAVSIIITEVEVRTAFAVFFLVFLLGFFEEQFGAGLKTALRVANQAGRIIAAVAIFLALRFTAGYWLGLYPLQTKTALVKGELLLVLWELLFVIIAGALVVSWARGKLKRTMRIVIGFSFLIVTAQLAFPEYAATWPTRQDIDKRLKEKGLGAVINETLGGGPPRANNLIIYHTPPQWEGRLQIPAYAGGGRLVDAVVINLTNEWTGYIALPWQWEGIRYTTENSREYWLHFLEDKEPILISPHHDIRIAKSGIFRARALDNASGEPQATRCIIRRIR